jgi:hypothetical protein
MSRYAVLVLISSLLPVPLAAQGPAAADPALRARDSARILRSARSEQSRFELVRRGNLPWTDAGGGVCETRDERIGRFCLSFSDNDDADWVGPPEDPDITRARDRLIARLDSAAHLIAGDRWVTGQRVRYLVEAGRFEEAAAAARECQADVWWCAALAGYSSHYAGRPAAADSAFTAMLASLPADERRSWTDLSRILDSCTAHLYRRLDEQGRDDFETRFWALADPFLSRPGNDLRSEHFARNVMDALQDRAKSTENLSWGNDLREILLRYGTPVGWERVRPRLGSSDPPSLVSHYSNSDQRLLPPCQTLATGDVAEGRWDEEEPRPVAGYTIPLGDSVARWIYPLRHQLAVFRRGDSAVIVAGYAIPTDSLPADATFDAGLAIASSGASEPVIARTEGAGPEGVLSAAVDSGTMLVSLELLSPNARLAARSRQGVRLAPLEPGRLALSDLLLLRAGEPLPDSLPAAVPETRGSSRVRPGEQVGLYWEIYGAAGEASRTLALSLRLVDHRKGVVRRLAERIGLAHSSDPIRMSWREPAASGSVTARSLTFQLPPDLPAGAYSLELTAGLPGQPEQVAVREIEVEG